jgi:hypothetical protein
MSRLPACPLRGSRSTLSACTERQAAECRIQAQEALEAIGWATPTPNAPERAPRGPYAILDGIPIERDTRHHDHLRLSVDA